MLTKRLILIATVLIFCLMPAAHVLAAPVPTVTLDIPSDVQIGEQFTFTVTFENSDANDIGYGPFIELRLPTTGIDGDDGISFVNATYLGGPLNTFVQTFPASGCVSHPFLRGTTLRPLQVCGIAGEQFVAIQLPFASFVPSQPPAEIEITALMSNLADYHQPLSIRAAGGFQFGENALDDPCCDPPLVSDSVSETVRPDLLLMSKENSTTDEETVVGPNFQRLWTITADIPNGQTITDFDISDYLPTNVVYMGVAATTPAGVVTLEPTIGASVTAANNTVVVNFASVTGTSAPNDIVIDIAFYGAEDALSPITGDDRYAVNRMSALGDWAPLDPRDAAGADNAFMNAQCPTVCPGSNAPFLMSIDGQKDAVVVNDLGATGPTPGDTLEYQIDFQVADTFAFQGVVITDILSDGQVLDAGFMPTLSFTRNGATSVGPFNAANFTESQFFTGGAPGPGGVVPPARVGDTALEFRISNELTTRGLQPEILGGCIPAGGTGVGLPDCTAFNGGPTSGTIIYRVVMRDDFVNQFPSGDPSVDHGDELDNQMQINGQILNTRNLSPAGHLTEDDTAESTLEVMRGEPEKAVFAVNGVACGAGCALIEVRPGDTVTYRIRHELPASDFENFTLTDYFSIPVFDAAEMSLIFDTTISAAIPPAGEAKYFNGGGTPLHTIMGAPAGIPIMTRNAQANTITFDWGSFDDPLNRESVIDLLYTVTVTDRPFADGLLLANLVSANHDGTNVPPTRADAIAQIEITTPYLLMRKGAVSTSSATGQFTPAITGPVTFNPPGSVNSFTGTLNSNGLNANNVNSNVGNLQVGDVVTFAIVIENLGSSLNGAFDITVSDVLPDNFVIPAGGLNLQVTLGNGAAVGFTPLGGTLTDADLFDNGIELIDPGIGVCGPFHPTDGTNIIVITYDLEMITLPPTDDLNIARMEGYASVAAGFDHTGARSRNDAAIIIIDGRLVNDDDAADAAQVGNAIATDPIIAKRVDNPFGLPGGAVVWTVDVTNPSALPVSNVVVSDSMPPEVVVQSVTTTQGTVVVNGLDYTVTIGTLAPGQTVIITIRSKVRDDLVPPYLIINTAYLLVDNEVVDSAQAQIIGARTLPSTGESPLSNVRKELALMALSLVVMIWWRGKG